MLLVAEENKSGPLWDCIRLTELEKAGQIGLKIAQILRALPGPP